MKPTHTDNPNHLPSGIADAKGQINSLSEEKTNRPEASLRTYKSAKSAAVIGLAISLGASGVLMPHHGDEAIAAEPFSLTPATTPPAGTRINGSLDNNQSSLAQKPEASTQTVEPSSPVVIAATPATIYHQVQAGDNFWLLAQKYQIPAEAIAKANNISIKATLNVGQSLRIPTSNAIHEMQLGEITEGNYPVVEVSKTQVQTVGASTSQGLANPELTLQNRQNDALQNLRGQREQLQETLSGWQPERTGSTNAMNQNSWSANAVANPLTTPTSGWLNSNPSTQSNNRSGLASQTLATPFQSPSVASINTPINLPQVSEIAPRQIPAIGTPEANSGSAATTTVNTTNLNTGGQSTFNSVAPSAPVVISNSSLSSAGNANWVNSSPRATTTNNWVTHNLEPVPTSTPAVVAAITTTPSVPTGANQEVAAASPEVHQVKAGETLDAIARRYSVSRQQLVRANGITNPNLLFVDQRLTIPASPTRVSSPAPITPINNAQKLGSNHDISVATPPINSNLAALPQATQGGFFGGSAGNESSPVVNQVTQDELVIERLRSDIRRMRDEYQQQRPNQPVLVNQTSTPIASPESSPLFPNNSRGLERVNPEFRDSRAGIGGNSTPLPAQPQIVAVAPSPAGSYNPMLQLPIGQMVSPELPPLAPADSYLPSSPARFNGYIWPAEGILTSGYGMRWGRMHRGIDIAAPIGTPVIAAAPGVVITAGWNDGGFGNLVEVEHPDGSITLYGHNDRILVKQGQKVAQGEQIAEMGTTGFSTGSHTHFEIHLKGAGAVNPIALMPRD